MVLNYLISLKTHKVPVKCLNMLDVLHTGNYYSWHMMTSFTIKTFQNICKPKHFMLLKDLRDVSIMSKHLKWIIHCHDLSGPFSHSWPLELQRAYTYPIVPLPGIGGLGGFCVGGVVRRRLPIFMFWVLTYDNNKSKSTTSRNKSEQKHQKLIIA